MYLKLCLHILYICAVLSRKQVNYSSYKNGSTFFGYIWNKWTICIFCQFVKGFSSHSRIFRSFKNVIIYGKGLQILTYTRQSWPLSSEDSLPCHTYFDTGQSFVMVISEDPWHSHLLPRIWQWSRHYLFKRLRSVAGGYNENSNLRNLKFFISRTTGPISAKLGTKHLW